MTTWSVDPLLSELATLKPLYDAGENHLQPLGALGVSCLTMLAGAAHPVPQGAVPYLGGQKQYIAFEISGRRSRPVRQDLLIADPGEFHVAWQSLIKAVDSKNRRLVYPPADAAIYTATQSFSCAVDLFKPGSRKTPGTHFEILVGTLLGAISGLERGKQIKVPGEGYTVPTDIVLQRKPGDKGPTLVIPTKITTRERVVQPFAHQRILDEVFGPGTYRSIVVMVSETQRDDKGKRGLNEICVPNQVGMFQAYLAKLSGLYYLDPPHSYCSAKFVKELPVKTVGALLSEDLPRLLSP